MVTPITSGGAGFNQADTRLIVSLIISTIPLSRVLNILPVSTTVECGHTKVHSRPFDILLFKNGLRLLSLSLNNIKYYVNALLRSSAQCCKRLLAFISLAYNQPEILETSYSFIFFCSVLFSLFLSSSGLISNSTVMDIFVL